MDDNLERNFSLRLEHCDKNSINQASKLWWFSVNLTGRANQFCFDKLGEYNLILTELANAVRARIHTEERTTALLQKQVNISLKQTLTEQPSKTGQKRFELMVSRYHNLQASLSTEFKKNSFIHYRFLNAVCDADFCRFAYHNPADVFQEVIFDLYSSLSRVGFGSSKISAPVALILDRRYHNSTKKCIS